MSERDTDRTAVKTYVPAYQEALWAEHAEALDMSKSEFVRTMVQAGRRGFSGSDPQGESAENESASEPALTERIVSELEEEPRSWEELLSELTDDVESRLDNALSTLQEENRVRYSGRENGYALIDDE